MNMTMTDNNSNRKLVSVREVKEILPIEGADKIELVKIDGWQVVSGKGNFKVGDYALFHEIDSFLDTTKEQYKFLEKDTIDWNGIRGARIKTKKLRGVISQGLALPVKEFPEVMTVLSDIANDDLDVDVSGLDFTELLGVVKWERIDSNSGGPNNIRKDNFPYFIQKTDQERIQNLFDYVDREIQYEVSQKMDGSSMTIFIRKNNDDQPKFGVCSRNFELEENESSNFWKAVKLHNIQEKLKNCYNEIALQGELVGPGVNGNRHKFKELDYYVFNVFDITTQEYLNPLAALNFCEMMGIKYVPVLEYRKFDFNNIDEAVNYSETIQNGEGVVFKQCRPHCIISVGKKQPPASFKIISPKYLIKYDE